MALGDRVAVLSRGVVQQVDTPGALCDRPANRFVAGFVGWPPMSFLEGSLVEAAGRLSFTADAIVVDVPPERRAWLAYAGRPVAVGLRAEDARLVPGATPGTIEMEVRRAEALGRAWLLTLSRGGWELTVRLTNASPPVEGSRAAVLLDLTRAHLFDPASGRALLAG
jgi:ABC-type sugar transport system ATPase subunit